MGRTSAATLALTMLLAACGGGERPATEAAAEGEADSASLPDAGTAGWTARTDEGATGLAAVSFEAGEGTLRVRPGPRAIYWREGDSVEVPFRVSGTFELVTEPDRPEAFGLFVGGRDLEGPAQDYLYFLVRHDGRYLLKHRAGGETHTLVAWTAHPAVRSLGEADGLPTNRLAVVAGPERLVFRANGRAVDSLPLSGSMVRAAGTAGIRINHGLDLRLTDYRVEEGPRAGG